MATFRDRVIPLANYPTGQRTFGPFSVPDTAQFLYFEVARCTSVDPTIWPNESTKLRLAFEGRVVGQPDWTPAGAFEAQGGIHVRRDGVELTLTTFRVSLPPLANRELRATITVEDGPLRTEGSIELRDE